MGQMVHPTFMEKQGHGGLVLLTRQMILKLADAPFAAVMARSILRFTLSMPDGVFAA